jgi:hypothetical protein
MSPLWTWVRETLKREVSVSIFADAQLNRTVAMLSMSKYSQEYINECRSSIELQVFAYKEMVSIATDLGGTREARLDSAIAAFEPMFLNNLMLALDNYFGSRSRTIEKKDGNPLNEVRVLCYSVMNNNGIMISDKTIKLDPSRTLLKYHVGDKIKLNVGDFLFLAKAFFTEIENKYL